MERTTYYSQETGYSVLRLKVRGRTDLVTVVGNLPEVNPGEGLRLDGIWTTHSQYGRQFRVERCEQVVEGGCDVPCAGRSCGMTAVKPVNPTLFAA